MHLDILVDTGARGGSYLSLKLWYALRRWHCVSTKLFSHGNRLLRAANPVNKEVSPMKVLGSTRVQLMFPPETKVFLTTVRVVRDLPYGLILGPADFLSHIRASSTSYRTKASDQTSHLLGYPFWIITHAHSRLRYKVASAPSHRMMPGLKTGSQAHSYLCYPRFRSSLQLIRAHSNQRAQDSGTSVSSMMYT